MARHGLKGIVFPSYLNQNTGPKKPHMQWIRHQNKGQRIRNLKNACRHVLAAKDAETRGLLDRIRAAVKDEPEPEFGFLHLVFAAVDACDQTGEPWTVCMKYLMDKFDDMKADHAEREAASHASA